MFAELRAIPNLVGRAPADGVGLLQVLRHRVPLGMVLAVGFLLVVSLIIGAALAAAGKYFGQWLPLVDTLAAVNFLVSFAEPPARSLRCSTSTCRWCARLERRLIGAFATALLFTVGGKTLIGLYLGRAPASSRPMARPAR